jgi:uncharacterized protein (TIGR00369 family)
MTQRTRLVSWEDPLAAAEGRNGLSGLDHLRGIRDGEIPQAPIAKLLGMEIDEVEEGRAVFSVEPGEHHYNPIGVVHGGLAATMLDSAMGCAVQTTLPAGKGYTTLGFTVNLVRPVTKDTGRLLCEGKVVHAGSRMATAEGRVFVAGTGKLVAHGSTTCMVLDLPG